MSLVTVQRSPSNSNASSTVSTLDNDEETEDRLKRGCESFFAMKGAALVLPHSKDTQRPIKKHPGLVHSKSASAAATATPVTLDLDLVPTGPPLSEALVGELQAHLQCIFWLLRPEDTIKMAVRLESTLEGYIRYMVLVSCLDTHQNTEETIILGVDIMEDKASIGLVLPLWADSHILMDGDGGFTVTTGDNERVNNFKPVSIQAMWSALQALYKASDLARQYNYFRGGLHMTWIGYYKSIRPSPLGCLKEWEYLPEIISEQSEEIHYLFQREGRYCPTEDELIRRFIFVKLKDIMIQTDLETATCRMLRNRLEEEIGKPLKEYKQFIDKQILLIIGQLDSATKIFDHVYLGSEWNASNLDELEDNGIGYILNITKECDNFFPDLFQYCNIRLYDEEESELLKHWDNTYRFLSKAKEAGSKVLVHCKMGVSRSASTVIAYAMKEHEMSLEKALAFVKEKRPIVRPNKSFLRQLQIYEGILEASRQRHRMFRSKSESSLSRSGSVECLVEKPVFKGIEELTQAHTLPRNHSWSPKDSEKGEQDLPLGAVGGTEPSFYIGADGHLGVGNLPGDAVGARLEGACLGESCTDDIVVPVPIVRPSSIVKLQKEGTLAAGKVPFLVHTEETTPSASAGISTVLSSEDPSGNVDTEENSSSEDLVLNTNNNSANELSAEDSNEQYQKICVKSKVTKFESNVIGAVEAAREEGTSGEEGEDDTKMETYAREAIPWNPGTVLRQKQEIEEKMSGGSPTNSLVMRFEDELEEEGGQERKGDTEWKQCEDNNQTLPTQELSRADELVSSSNTMVESTPAITAESFTDSPSSDVANIQTDTLVHEGSGSTTDSNEMDQGDSCNVAEDDEQMDTDEVASNLKTETVYTTSGEELQMAIGLVERQKREFEQKKKLDSLNAPDRRASETDGAKDEAMEASPPPRDPKDAGVWGSDSSRRKDVAEDQCSPGESMAGVSDSDDASSQTAYSEEGSTWKVGDVRRHRMSLEGKMESGGTPPSPTKRLSRRGEDGEENCTLTEDELQGIQDMGSIPLRTPSPEVEGSAVGEDGAASQGEEAKGQGILAVTEQVKMLELKRCKSISKMSNEKVRRRYGGKERDTGTPSQELVATAPSSTSSTSLHVPVDEIPASTTTTPCSSQRLSPQTLLQEEDEPLVQLNPDFVKLFTGQLAGNVNHDAKRSSSRVSPPRKSESDKDADVAGAKGLQGRRQHGPSHPLNALGQGRGRGVSGRRPSSKGKFYSTM